MNTWCGSTINSSKRSILLSFISIDETCKPVFSVVDPKRSQWRCCTWAMVGDFSRTHHLKQTCCDWNGTFTTFWVKMNSLCTCHTRHNMEIQKHLWKKGFNDPFKVVKTTSSTWNYDSCWEGKFDFWIVMRFCNNSLPGISLSAKGFTKCTRGQWNLIKDMCHFSRGINCDSACHNWNKFNPRSITGAWVYTIHIRKVFLYCVLFFRLCYVNTGPFYWRGLSIIPAWVSNYAHYKVWDEITYSFPNLGLDKLFHPTF